MSLALAFSGNLTTSNALALCANRLTKPRSSKAEINLCIPDFDLRLSEFFISSYEGDIPEDLIFLLMNINKFFCFFVSIEQISYIYCSIKVLILKQC